MTANIDTPAYQLRFHLTRDDVAAFEFLPRELLGMQKVWFFGPILVCGAAAGFFEDRLRALLPWDPATRWGQLATVLIAIAIGYALSLVLLTWRTRRRIATTPLPSTPTAIDVYPQVFLVTEDGDYRSYVWSRASLVDTPGHVFITQGTRKPVIIPLRAFIGPEAKDAFVRDAVAWGITGRIAEENAVENGEEKS